MKKTTIKEGIESESLNIVEVFMKNIRRNA